MSDQVTTTTHIAQPAPEVPPARLVSAEEDAAREKAIAALLNAAEKAGAGGAMAQGAQDANDFGRAALSFAQAAVILDPNLVAPGGVPPNALHPPLPHIQEQIAPPAPQQGGSGA